MIQIIGLLKKEFIIKDLASKTKSEVLAEMSAALAARTGVDAALVSRTLEERERLGTTGIGDGVAIPHGKLENIDSTFVFFGKSEAGIPFNAMDGRPVHLFFMLIAPENINGKHLKALAKLSRMLKDDKFRADLCNARSEDSLYQIIRTKDEEIL